MRRRMLFGLLTLGACASNSAVLAEEALSTEDFIPPPLRKTLEPQVEIFSGVAGTRASNWSADLKRTAATAGGPDVSGIFDHNSLRDEPNIEPIAMGATAPDFANTSPTAPPTWTKELNNILGRNAGGNIPFGYPTIVEAIKFQAWLGSGAAQVYVWKLELENRRQGGEFGYRTGWELDCAPTPQTMFYAKSFYSPVFQTSLVEIKPGYAVADSSNFAAFPIGKFYIGPFAVLNSNWRDKISKAGLHLTFGEIGAFNLSVAGGYAHESLFAGGGAFGLIEASRRF